MLITIPNEWTTCEAYRGFVIAVKDGWYKGFSLRTETTLGKTRAEVRREIDDWWIA